MDNFLLKKFTKTVRRPLVVISGYDGVNTDWLVLRGLSFWIHRSILQSQSRDANGKRGVGVVVMSFCHDFNFYANGLAQFDIDLAQCQADGLFQFVRGDESLQPGEAFAGLHGVACQKQAQFKRVVLLLHEPERSIEPPIRNFTIMKDKADRWASTVKTATGFFHNALVASAVETPSAFSNLDRLGKMLLRVEGCTFLVDLSNAIMSVRQYNNPDTADGIVKFAYADSDNENIVGYSIKDNGRTVLLHEEEHEYFFDGKGWRNPASMYT